MAGFVSRRSADRWNNAARIVEGGGAGNRQVPVTYRTPRVVCDDLPLPGSYPAVAGATIPAGITGPVVYGGKIYQAINQSQCQVRFGDAVGLHVSPDCDGFFVPCVCDCAEPEPTNCCQKKYAVCIAGQVFILDMNESFALANRWFLCCANTEVGGFQVEIKGWLRCDPSSDRISFVYGFNNFLGGVFANSVELVDLCSNGSANATIDLSDELGYPCEFTVFASEELISCAPCGEADPTPIGCCTERRWFCVNNESVELALDGGTHTFTVTDCCDPCGTATLAVTLACNEDTGVVTLQTSYVCDGGPPTVETTTISQVCTSNDPLVVTRLNPCFLQIVITRVQQDCISCIPAVDTACCDAVPETLEMVIVGGAFAGTYSMTYAAGEWTAQPPATFTGRLTCEAGPSWQLVFEMDTYGTATATCDPFQLSMDVTGNGYSITSITISEP